MLRRLIAAWLWILVFVILMEVLRFNALGPAGSYALMFALLLALLYFFEKVILVERRAFTCRKCGYDLQNLPEDRCPECGTTFDPAEREQVLARIAVPPPRPKHRVIAVILVIVLSMGVAAGLVVWRRVSQAAATRAAPPPAQPAPPNPSGEQ